jgi:hypothetical protein
MKTYPDVRLVGTPTESIGKFGGDTDNWEWPRHTGDFALFRVYSDKNGRPSEYSTNNVPLTPKHSLASKHKRISARRIFHDYGLPRSHKPLDACSRR